MHNKFSRGVSWPEVARLMREGALNDSEEDITIFVHIYTYMYIFKHIHNSTFPTIL